MKIPNLLLPQLNLNYSDEAEQMSDDIAEIVEDVYVSDEMSSTGKTTYFSDYLPDCVTITTVITDTSKEKTIDFGGGCELRNGKCIKWYHIHEL